MDYPNSAVDLSKKLDILTKQACLVFRDIDDEFLGFQTSSPTKWISKLVSTGVKKVVAESVAFNFFNIEQANAANFNEKTSIWFDGGVYCKEKMKYFLWELVDESFEAPLLCGKLTGEIRHKSSENHQEILSLFTDLERRKFGYAKVLHATISKRTLSVSYGKKEFPVKEFDSSQLKSSCGSSISSSLSKETWRDYILQALSHVSKSKRGNLIFLCGDYTETLAEQFIKTGQRMTTRNFSKEKISKDTIQVLNIEDHSEEKLKQAIANSASPGQYCVFIGKYGNITQLFSKVKDLASPDRLLELWGTHFFNVAIPKLCDSCKEKREEQANLEDSLISVTEGLDSHWVIGIGCDNCLNGYSGTVFAKENMSDRSVLINSIIDVYKKAGTYSEKSGDVLPRDPVSPYSLASNFYKRDTPNLKRSILLALQEGSVQISDVNGLLT